MISWLPFLLAKAILCLSHLIMVLSKHTFFIVSIIIENLFFFSFLLLTFKFINDFLLMLSSQGVFNIVHIKLVLQIINVCEFLNINGIESFKFLFKTFIFFLVFWFNIFNTLESLLSSFKFLLSSSKFVSQFTFIKF